MENIVPRVGLLTSFKVLLTLFFAQQLAFIDYLSGIQESADTFNQQSQPHRTVNTFDYIIGNIF